MQSNSKFMFEFKYQVFFFMIISYCILVYFFFANSIGFIPYFIKQANRPVFTIDINICAKQFIYISFFIAYVLFIPFVISILMLWSRSSSTEYYYSVWYQFIIIFVYTHLISIIYNQYDFISFYQSSIFNTYIEGIDLAYLRIQYKGFFWDFFISFFIFISYVIFILNFPKNAMIYIYDKAKYSYKNKIIFIQTWLLRFCIYITIYYFFGGGSYTNDAIRIAFSFFFVEIIFITFRFFFFQIMQNKNYMLNYIKIFIILEKKIYRTFYNCLKLL